MNGLALYMSLLVFCTLYVLYPPVAFSWIQLSTSFCFAFPWHEAWSWDSSAQHRFPPALHRKCWVTYNLCYSHCRWWRTILKSILLDGQQNALVSCWTHTRPQWEHKGRFQLSQAVHLVSISWDTGVLQRKRWDNECVLVGYTSFLSGSKSNWEVNPTAKIFNEN